MRQIFLSKNYTYTETRLFADIHAIRILNERKKHSLPAVL